jgi:VIT1/CCC1 family predicted Fe2+/Mn2+ transporter
VSGDDALIAALVVMIALLGVVGALLAATQPSPLR